MKASFDILGLGCTAVDDILYVEKFPRADVKTRVLARERHCGGLTATALVAGARLGARCAYAGTLGSDEHSRFVLEALRRESVNVRHTLRRRGACPVRSVIVVDETRQTRNILFDHSGAVGADPRHPAKQLIQSSRVLLVDRFGIAGMIRAARLARAAGVPIVSDFENSDAPGFAELFGLVDHLIVSDHFAGKFTGARTPAAAALKLWSSQRTVVVVTCGAAGCWVVHGTDTPPKHFPAFRVQATDTTGCGDVFHGAYAAGLARGLELADRICLAAATAALKATRRGGQAGIPTRREVERFVEREGAWSVEREE